MSKKTIFLLSLLVFTQFFLVAKVKADDLVLTGSINGFYYSMENILTEGECVVGQGSMATLSTTNTITLNPGFHVILGGSLLIDSDTDDDGLPDNWEMSQFSNLNQGLNDDYDDDGITHYWEYLLGLSGVNPEFDCDYDGLPDWYEVSVYENLEHDIDSGDCDCD